MQTVRSQDGTTITYDRIGDGPPVILVTAALGTRGFDPLSPARQLAARFTAISYDRRGRGDSGDTPPYAVEREVEDIAALVEAVGGTAFAYGISSGAVLALEAANRLPGITKVAMYEPPFIIDDSRPPLPADYVPRLNELIAAGRRGEAVELLMTVAIGVPAEYLGPMRADPSWAGMEAVAHTIAYDGMVVGETMSGKPLPADRWTSVAASTLVIAGSNSEPFFHSGARALADLLPGARFRSLEGQDHAVSPDALAPVLIEFFG
jgi:pimeloyl-ACP methyl ester carboxylesterase